MSLHRVKAEVFSQSEEALPENTQEPATENTEEPGEEASEHAEAQFCEEWDRLVGLYGASDMCWLGSTSASASRRDRGSECASAAGRLYSGTSACIAM